MNLELRIKNLSRIFLVALFFILLALFYQFPATAQSTVCPSQSADPRVQNGLISTPDISGSESNFSNATGTCAIDTSKIRFAPFKIPAYEDLKSLYYTQSKSPKSTSTAPTLAAITDGNIYNYTNATEVSVGAYSYSGTAVVFVEGNLSINGNITGTDLTGLVFVVKGDINIAQIVTSVDAVIISSGIIYTAGAGCASGVSASQLVINGSLISLDSSKPIKFCRILTDNSQPAEKIIHQPKYLVILRNIFSDTYQKWSEIQ